MTTLGDLPVELVLDILQRLPREVLKNCRLVNSRFRDAATPSLFTTVNFSLTEQSWKNLKAITSSEHFRHHVRKLYYNARILPRYGDQESWEAAIDMRPIFDIYCSDRSDETGERIYDEDGMVHATFRNAYDKLQVRPWNIDEQFAKYTNLSRIQAAVIRQAKSELHLHIERLSHLNTIEWAIPNAFEQYEPVVIEKEDSNASYDKYLNWLTGKRGPVNTPGIVQSFFQHRIRGLTLFLPLFCAKTSATALPDLGTMHMEFVTKHLGYEHRQDVFYTITNAPDFACLRRLQLRVLYSRADPDDGMEATFCSLLEKAVNLRELNMSFSQPGPSRTLTEQLWLALRAQMLALKHLVLSDLSTNLQVLEKFLHNYSHSLRILELRDITLIRGKWAEFLRTLPEHLSLDRFNARRLFTCRYVSGDIDDPSQYEEEAHLLSSVQTYQPLQDYILHGGAWPGLVSESESTLGN
jgi:hypothetical protein